MSGPVLLRKASGVALLGAAAAGGVTVAAALAHSVAGTVFVLAFLGVFFLPSLVAAPFLVRTGRRLLTGRHEGDRMLFWSLLYAPGPAFLAWRADPPGRALGVAALALVAAAFVLYAAGTLSPHDPPG